MSLQCCSTRPSFCPTLLRFQSKGEAALNRNAVLESYVLHLRNLINFFFCKPNKPDDVVGRDFVADWGPTISLTLEKARTRANKEMNHITSQRKEDTDPEKSWEFGALVKEIWSLATKFADRAPKQALHENVRTRFLGTAFQ